jgi:broad specificity phosphatase PhoE
LTTLGIHQATRDATILSNLLVQKKSFTVYTSVLVRAQETALILFPHQKIFVMDHLKETSDHRNCKGSSYPLESPRLQHKKIAKLGLSFQNLIYQKGLTFRDGLYKNSVKCLSGNIETFLQYNQENFKNNETIILVVHANLIQKFLQTTEKITNGAIYQVFNDTDGTFKIPYYFGKIYYKLLFH